MTDIIVRKGDAIPDSIDFLCSLDSYYFEESMLHVKSYASGGQIHFTMLDNALQSGKSVTSFLFDERKSGSSSTCDVLNALSALCGGITTPSTIRAYLETIDQGVGSEYECRDLSVRGYEIRMTVRKTSAVRVYSPFALARLKPLTEIPAKWTLVHAKRALANGQFNNLHCNGKYSDDYAFDAATNYGMGQLDGMAMLQKLVTSPSGWWTSLNPETLSVSICCHHFDSNRMVLAIDKCPTAIGIAASRPEPVSRVQRLAEKAVLAGRSVSTQPVASSDW